MKKKFWFLPIVIGGIIGMVFIKPDENHMPKKGAKTAPLRTNVETAPRTGAKTAPLQNYILTSQSLLAKAIEISQKNDKNNNPKIVQLINEAINTASAAIASYPQNYQPYLQRAKIYQTVRNYLPQAQKMALADLQKAVANNPADPNLIKKLAEEQIRAGKLQTAKTNYTYILGLLTDKKQKEIIKKEIAGLEKLIAQTVNPNKNHTSKQKNITLPEAPPLLEAKDLAGGLIIASPADSTSQDAVSATSEVSSNAFSGTAVLLAGETEIKICNDNLSPTAQVYLAAEDDIENQILVVKRKVPYNPETKECSHFVAGIQKPMKRGLKFRWWVID